jgi:O-antigen ligase
MAVFFVIIGQKSIEVTMKYFLIIFIAAAIIIPIAYQIPYIREAFGERLLAVLDDSIEDSSIMYRNIAKFNAIRIFIESPIIGNGWAAVRNSFNFNGVSIYAHNNYLEIAADYGIIGAILFFTRNFVFGFKCFTKLKKNKAYLVGTILLMAMVLLDWGQVSYVYVYMMVIWGIVYKFVQFECFAGEEVKN